jgi:signal-transduction protein with cAMP-binding, CBS, and nucleotidyltransferase domain
MSFRQELEQETVAQLPVREAIVVRPFTLVRAAVAVMRARSLGCCVMVDHGRIPSGIFTEHSLLHVLVRGDSLDDSPVCRYADPNFISVRLRDPISCVWEAIQRAGARFVCVTDDDGRLMGLTGQRGLAEYVADCFAQQVAVQRLGSTPWMHAREGA